MDTKKSHPIIFSGNMIRAILDGKKTMTRRVIKPQPQRTYADFDELYIYADKKGEKEIKCPYGQSGMKLWVRETYVWASPSPIYKAGSRFAGCEPRWTSPIYMPKKDSRITLEITDVRVERVQEITETDAISEGVKGGSNHPDFWVGAFKELWNSINAKKGYGWDTNCWCWVIEFRRVKE